MKGFVIFALLALFAVPAWGQVAIVKCKDAKGHVMYVSGGCETGQTVDTVKYYDPVRYDPKLVAQTRSTQREVDARRAGYGRQAQAAHIPVDGGGLACESAKAHRETVLKAAGMSRTYDLLQQLDENVRRACR